MVRTVRTVRTVAVPFVKRNFLFYFYGAHRWYRSYRSYRSYRVTVLTTTNGFRKNWMFTYSYHVFRPVYKTSPGGTVPKTIFLQGFCVVFHKRCPTTELTARGAQRGLHVKVTKFGPGRAFRGNFEAVRRGQKIVDATAPTPPRPYLVAA